MYTLDDLERAKEELRQWDDRFANDSSNNPNKYESQRRAAREKVRVITDSLKASGTIALTDKEKLERELDSKFPSSQSNDVVEHDGIKYRRKFFPLERSRSRKSVTVWGKTWEKLSEG